MQDTETVTKVQIQIQDMLNTLCLVDEEFRQAVKFLRDRMDGNITMDMNKQPCSISTSHR